MRIQTKPEPYCPECGAWMVLRRPKPGQEWRPFWGCSLYPGCKGTRQIQEDGKAEDDWEEPLDPFCQKPIPSITPRLHRPPFFENHKRKWRRQP